MIEFMFPSGRIVKINIILTLIFIVAIFLIVSVIKIHKLKTLLKRFSNEDINTEFIKSCEGQLKLYWARGNEKTYDILSVMLCSAYLRIGNTDAFFEKLNSLKPFSRELEYMIDILLIQYYTGIFYAKVSQQYPPNPHIARDEERRKILERYVSDFEDESSKTLRAGSDVSNELVDREWKSFLVTYYEILSTSQEE